MKIEIKKATETLSIDTRHLSEIVEHLKNAILKLMPECLKMPSEDGIHCANNAIYDAFRIAQRALKVYVDDAGELSVILSNIDGTISHCMRKESNKEFNNVLQKRTTVTISGDGVAVYNFTDDFSKYIKFSEIIETEGFLDSSGLFTTEEEYLKSYKGTVYDGLPTALIRKAKIAFSD